MKDLFFHPIKIMLVIFEPTLILWDFEFCCTMSGLNISVEGSGNEQITHLALARDQIWGMLVG